MTFDELIKDIKSLNFVDGVDFSIIGYSLLGTPLYCAHIGDYSKNQIILEGGIHAREYIVAEVMVKQVKYLVDKSFVGGMYFIPLINPDGAELVIDGVDFIKCEKLKQNLLNVNDTSTDFSVWKANANAVDMNVNFDALWGKGSQNVFCIAPGNFVGYYPNSEREVKTLIDFTIKNNPIGTLSYHTKGEVIYYGFETLTDSQIERDRSLAENIAKVTGYKTIKTENSTGAYPDWISKKFGLPSLTIEVGSVLVPHPIGQEYVDEIFELNKDVPLIYLNDIIALTDNPIKNNSSTTMKINAKNIKEDDSKISVKANTNNVFSNFKNKFFIIK